MSKLPKGWADAELGDLLGIQSGFAFKSSEYKNEGHFLIRIGNVQDGEVSREKPKYVQLNEQTKHFELSEGDILTSLTGNIGRVARIEQQHLPAALNQRVARLIPAEKLEDDSYLFCVLNSSLFREALAALGKGGAQQNVSPKTISDIAVPLPPLPEQRRIVAKLDSLRARSSRARQELDRIPALIERYKQAILAKAFSGELTADWREAKAPEVTGGDLVHELARRRAKLAEASGARKGRVTADGNAGRVPVALPPLPISWSTSTLEAITSPSRLIQYGILKPGPDIPDGIPYVKVMNIKGGRVELGSIRRTSRDISYQYRRSSISTGDILLSIRGTVGRLAFVPEQLDGGNITQDSVRISTLEGISSQYVYWFLHSPAAQMYFKNNQKGVAVRGINVGDVRPMEVPIPPLIEQEAIVTKLKRAFSSFDKIVEEHARATLLLPKLDQAILARAFRGELAPQDPNDEPASVLLERIRTEREAQPTKPRRGRKASA